MFQGQRMSPLMLTDSGAKSGGERGYTLKGRGCNA